MCCMCVCVCDIPALRSYLNLDVYTKKAQCHEFCCVARPVHVCAVIERTSIGLREYNIHVMHKYREKANSIGRRPTV